MENIFSLLCGIMIGVAVVLVIGTFNEKVVTYYPHAIIYMKGEDMNVVTFTVSTPGHVKVQSGYVYIGDDKIESTEGATSILNVETLTPIKSIVGTR